MVAYPEVQQRAQEELNPLVGQHPLPDFAAKDSLPYVSAPVKQGIGGRIPLGMASLTRLTRMMNAGGISYRREQLWSRTYEYSCATQGSSQIREVAIPNGS
ncbi:hypothetical protein C8Q77DRAFT_769694 [Trametes polyzona]|nr:hypothetical protein C8Q77DRAFT_769694 [Trametes polyzona]